MAKEKWYSQEEKDEILRLHKDGKNAAEIAEAIGRKSAGIYRILRKEKNSEIRDCEFCGKTIKDADAVFCPYCGKKILTEKDRVMEHLNDIGKCIGEFPNSFRDRIMANVNEVRKYIKGH